MNYFLEKFFGPKRDTIIFHMDSGDKIKVRCTEYRFEHDTSGAITSYNLKGLVDTSEHDPLFWLSLKKIERIEVIK